MPGSIYDKSTKELFKEFATSDESIFLPSRMVGISL